MKTMIKGRGGSMISWLRGNQTQQGVAKPIFLIKFPERPHEIEKKWDPQEAPLDPPIEDILVKKVLKPDFKKEINAWKGMIITKGKSNSKRA